MNITFAAFIIAVSIAMAGLANRYQIVVVAQQNALAAAWIVDGLTGAVRACDRTGCTRVETLK